jgi:hypothetical protein
MTKRAWALEQLRKKLKVLTDHNDQLRAEGKTDMIDQAALDKVRS